MYSTIFISLALYEPNLFAMIPSLVSDVQHLHLMSDQIYYGLAFLRSNENFNISFDTVKHSQQYTEWHDESYLLTRHGIPFMHLCIQEPQD